MPILVSAMLLLATAAAFAGVRLLRPRFRHSWLIGLTGAAVAWLSTLLWIPDLPTTQNINLWQSYMSRISFVSFSASRTSWPYAFSVATIALVAVLRSPSRSGFPGSSAWAGSVAIAGLGVFAVSGNGPLTVVLLWAGLDLSEAGLVLAGREAAPANRRLALTSLLRLGSMGLLLLSLVLGGSESSLVSPIHDPGRALQRWAALIRLVGVAVPSSTHLPSRGPDEIGTTLHLVSAISTIGFLSLLGPENQVNDLVLEIVCGLVALYTAWMWLRTAPAGPALSLWIISVGTLAVAASARGNPLGATAWGVAMLLAGFPVFGQWAFAHWMGRALPIGLWICSSLPLAVTASGVTRMGDTLVGVVPLFIMAQGLLLAGLFYRIQRVKGIILPYGDLPMTRMLHGSAFVLPLGAGVLLGVWGWAGALHAGSLPLALGVVGAAVAAAWAKGRFGFMSLSSTEWIPPRIEAFLRPILREVSRMQAGLQRGAESVTRTIEGEAGVLWSLLVLVLVVSLLFETGG